MAEAPLVILNVTILNPFAKLRRKFGFEQDGDYLPFAVYDGYRTPAERSGNANLLELEDLLITAAMNSRIGSAAVWSFWKGITTGAAWYTKANNLLARLPLDLHLADADEDDLAAITGFFAALCEVSWIKTGVAGKVLCRKRPRSGPMLDGYVLPLACHLSLRADGLRDFDKLPWRPWYDTDRALRHLRAMCQAGRGQLERLCRRFRDLPDNPELTPLRALEALLWWEVAYETGPVDPGIADCQKIMGW